MQGRCEGASWSFIAGQGEQTGRGAGQRPPAPVHLADRPSENQLSPWAGLGLSCLRMAIAHAPLKEWSFGSNTLCVNGSTKTAVRSPRICLLFQLEESEP